MANQSNSINKNKEETKQITASTSKLSQSKSPSKNDNNLRSSTKSLPKEDKSKGMVTTKTSNLSQDSSKKNDQTSPSKVKLDINKEIREN